MEAYFLYLLSLSSTEQYESAQKQQFESKFHIIGNKLTLFITMAVLSASFSYRTVSFKTYCWRTKRQKEHKYHNENSRIVSLATMDWTIVPKTEHPLSRKLKTAK